MSRRTVLVLTSAVLSFACAGGVRAGEHGLFHGGGHSEKYDVVQGYIVLPQASQPAAQHVVQQPQQGAPSAQSAPTAQLQAPAAPQVQLQVQPQVQLQAVQAPVVQYQLAQPAPVQMLQLAAAPVQTLQLAAPAPVQTLQLAAAPAPMLQVSTTVHYVQLAAAPQAVSATVATPVTLLLPRRRCLFHPFCAGH